MLKTLSLPVEKFLPLHKQLNTLRQVTRSGFLSLLYRQIKPKAKRGVLFAYLLVTVLFLFLNPNIGAQAPIIEAVLPSTNQKAFVTIAETVNSVAIPEFSTPSQGYISTYFSKYHIGIDLPNPTGTPIKAIANGEVVFAASTSSTYGKKVIIRHEAGFESLYAHFSKILVKPGDIVTTDTVIGLVGSTGYSTGPHLHLEVYFNGSPIDPLTYISLEELVTN